MSTHRILIACTALACFSLAMPFVSGQEKGKQDTKDDARKEALKEVVQKAQDEYRLYFKEPKTALEFWAALAFEVQVGKFDVAAYHLDKLLKVPQKEADEDLLKVEEAEGLNNILRLRLVKEWSKNKELEDEARKNVDILVNRVMAALDKKLGDQEMIRRFIDGLYSDVPEIRSYSLYQLLRTKHRASPVLADVLRKLPPEKQSILKNAMVQLDSDIMPPLLELYKSPDAKAAAVDAQFHLNLLWLARSRMEKRVIPYLWHMSSASIYPKVVRDEAKDTLAYLLGTSPDRLPSAKLALMQLAENYYQHKVRLPDTVEVADRDDPTKLIPMPAYKLWFVSENGKLSDTPFALKPDEIRFEFGLRYARQALDLDNGFLPAQALYLALLLEAEFTRKPYEAQLDKIITEKPAPALQRLLAKIDMDVLTAALERATEEQDYAVILPLIQAVGERGDVRLSKPSSGNSPGLLVKLLYYPDRRVQFAAASTLLKLPASQSPVASARIVEVLARFLASDAAPKVLIIYAKDERAAQLRNALTEAGYQADVAATVNIAVTKLHKSADYDAIILNDDVPPIELPYILSQLRADHEAGRLPLLLVAPAAKQTEVKALAAKTRNTFILPEVYATKGTELKKQLEDAIKFAAAPEPLKHAPQEQQPWLQYEVRRGKGQAVSVAEKKKFAADSLDWFAQMARGELAGYDLLPAKDVLFTALKQDETAPLALRVVARLATVEAQRQVANVLLDAKKTDLLDAKKTVFYEAVAKELNRHIQKNGLVLTPDQVNLLRLLEQQTDLAAPLRGELAVLVGTLRASPQITGARLMDYLPDPEPPPAKKDEK
ncbi:MAG TPA: hypothetical protein VE988_22530 [Gemmataceae bacterium]|nr:hypothetical protein [Gemmataceae bacterium]